LPAAAISDLGMEFDDSVHKCVAKFMIKTCNCKTTENATKVSLIRLVSRAFDAVETLVSGSSAEFCIKPMLSCIGDIDIMVSDNEIIAIPAGQLPPAKLNKHRKIAFTIIDTDNPGYVYLRQVFEDGRCVKDNASSFMINPDLVGIIDIERDVARDFCKEFQNPKVFDGASARSLFIPAISRHGPAMEYVCNKRLRYDRVGININVDGVSSIRCPIFPTQAAEWPTRHREHGWPDQTTINLVVSNACDLVQAVHPSCRDDEWESKYQWRLSFSRAEVTLLNSWTPVQQIVYHMLRYVLKRQVLLEINVNNKTQFSNYHIKTSMLWACEQNPPSWWSAKSSLVKICSWMLYKLSDCVEAKHCQHYFIDSWNLLDHFADDSSHTICKRLRSLAYEPVLLSWFVENYIRRSALYCPKNVSMLFEDISSGDKLKKAVNAVVDWKLDMFPRERYADKYEYEKMISVFVGITQTDAAYKLRHTSLITKVQQHVDKRLQDYFIAVGSLHVTQAIPKYSLSQELLEILLTLLAPGVASACNSATTGVTAGTSTSMRKATQLATLTTVRSNALEMLHDEMAKAYLHQILNCGQESACCIARVLLAALYYKSGCFHAAANHCKDAINQRHCDHRSVCCIIGAEQLPRIDLSVDSVGGLITLYQHVRKKALHDTEQPENGNKPAFTSKLLAHYFYTVCSPVTDARRNQMSLRNYRYELCTTKRLLISDVLMFKTMEMQLDECTEPSVAAAQDNDTDNSASSSTDTSLLVTLLELVALEKLISHREVMVHELLQSERFPAEMYFKKFPLLNEFEVLHAYKCGLFKVCVDMCRNHLDKLLRVGRLKIQHFFVATPTFYGLLDGEILSLFGIIRLMYPIWFLFEIKFPEYIYVSLPTLLLYLMVQCQKKLRSDLLDDTLQLIRKVHDKLFQSEFSYDKEYPSADIKEFPSDPTDDMDYYLDRLILKLSYRSLRLYIVDSASNI